MKTKTTLAQKIKALRNRKGFSQEELAEKTALSLRTIQRIENGETEPRGDSIKRLANAFDVPSEEITDWTLEEDNGFLTSMNLSALSFLFFPLLGVLVPLIIWISKKDKIKDINKVAKSILNFQITWTILFFVGHIGIIMSLLFEFREMESGSYLPPTAEIILLLVFVAAMYLYNLTLIITNSFRLRNNKEVFYQPKISFIGK